MTEKIGNNILNKSEPPTAPKVVQQSSQEAKLQRDLTYLIKLSRRATGLGNEEKERIFAIENQASALSHANPSPATRKLAEQIHRLGNELMVSMG